MKIARRQSCEQNTSPNTVQEIPTAIGFASEIGKGKMRPLIRFRPLMAFEGPIFHQIHPISLRV